MKKKITYFCITIMLSSVCFLFCLKSSISDVDKSVAKKTSVTLLTPATKQNQSGYNIEDEFVLKMIFKYPQYLENIEINFGEPSNFDNIQNDTDVKNIPHNGTKTYSIRYKTPGIKIIRIVGIIPCTNTEFNDSCKIEMCEAVKIIQKNIFCWPTQPSLSMPCSLSIHFVNNSSDEPAFQWLKNKAILPNQKYPTIHFASLTPTDAGEYQCIAKNSFGADTSKIYALILKANQKPTIFLQPLPLEIVKGKMALFVCKATPVNVTYQWSRNGSAIPGASNDTFIIQSTTMQDNNTKFFCTVTNPETSVKSAEVMLKISETDQKPSITKQPTPVTVVVGEKAQFNIDATGTALTYQWQKNRILIPGANLKTYEILSVVAADNNALYRCIASNTIGSDTSKEVVLSIKPADDKTLPVITQHPVNASITDGTDVNFSIAATGATNYQWQKNNTNITGATQPTFSMKAVAADDGAKIRCVVSNKNGLTNSKEALLTVTKNIQTIAIKKHPETRTVLAGNSVSFSVEATGTNITYQWQKNGTPIGSNLNTLTLAMADKKDNDATIKCVLNNSLGKVESNAAKLSVQWAPVIGTSPANVTAKEKETATFSITMSDEGNPKCTYQWYSVDKYTKSTKLTNGTTKTISITASKELDGNNYYCEINNSATTSINSFRAVLTVLNCGGTVTINGPSSATVDENISFTLDLTGWDPQPTDYKWTYGRLCGYEATFNATAQLDQSEVMCVVSNKAGSVTKTLEIDVKEQSKPPKNATISIIQGSESVSVGDLVVLNCQVGSGTEPFDYQWVGPSGDQIDSNTLRFVADENSSGDYYCEVTNEAGETVSNSIILTVTDTKKIRKSNPKKQ